MKKLDMTNCVFIGFPFVSKDVAYKKLKSILKHNIYCCVQDFKKYGILNYGIFSEPYGGYDSFCLSTIPYFSKYSHIRSSEGSFAMFTNEHFYLIFSDEILSLYDSRKGYMSDEYYIRGSIPVKEHLIGIGNARPTIDYQVVLAYFLFKYYNGEISREEFCKETLTTPENSYYDLSKHCITEIIESYGFLYERSIYENPICKLKLYSIEKFLKGEDKELSDICKEHNLKMFDQNGILVDKKSQLQTLKMMKEYILENLDKINLSHKNKINYLKNK